MIHPTDEQLLAGIAAALKDTVLAELARGSAARKQLQATIETLRRMAFAAPGRDAALAADNADMVEVLRQVEDMLGRAATSFDDNDATEDRFGFYSGEYATTTNRPELIITYQP